MTSFLWVHTPERSGGLLLEPPSFRTRRRGQELQFRHLPEERDVAVLRRQHNAFQFLALLQRLQILQIRALERDQGFQGEPEIGARSFTCLLKMCSSVRASTLAVTSLSET